MPNNSMEMLPDTVEFVTGLVKLVFPQMFISCCQGIMRESQIYMSISDFI